jgi:hypothetical protein
MTVGKTTKNKAIGYAISSRVENAGDRPPLVPMAFFMAMGMGIKT